ncbi:hypothetical protein N0B31_02845 [Salinirubellus salinus]|uniref:Uncharacterized protein n=1 Tax=Salinirubellus salinus TaxID=1364945 RepID=A0A9E7R4I5_9EURY|nr:hypothetical protein [Salinirubellus salinus]UWM55228.1 hypothetical protein N0B31_02845 [Salinirubellus salinus]
MSTRRDTTTDGDGRLHEGQRVRARYRGGAVEGEVLEVRRAGDATRVVLDVDGEAELDTDASRVEPVGPRCPRCEASLPRRRAYRCGACGADLVQ